MIKQYVCSWKIPLHGAALCFWFFRCDLGQCQLSSFYLTWDALMHLAQNGLTGWEWVLIFHLRALSTSVGIGAAQMLHKEPVFLWTQINLYISDVFQWRVSFPYWLVPQLDVILTYAQHFILDISLLCINLLKYLENTYINFVNEQTTWEKLSNCSNLS